MFLRGIFWLAGSFFLKMGAGVGAGVGVAVGARVCVDRGRRESLH